MARVRFDDPGVRLALRAAFTIKPRGTGTDKKFVKATLESLRSFLRASLRMIALDEYGKVPDFIIQGVTWSIYDVTKNLGRPQAGVSHKMGHVTFKVSNNQEGKIFIWQDLGTRSSPGRYIPRVDKKGRPGPGVRRVNPLKKRGGPFGPPHPGIKPKHLTRKLHTAFSSAGIRTLMGQADVVSTIFGPISFSDSNQRLAHKFFREFVKVNILTPIISKQIKMSMDRIQRMQQETGGRFHFTIKGSTLGAQ